MSRDNTAIHSSFGNGLPSSSINSAEATRLDEMNFGKLVKPEDEQIRKQELNEYLVNIIQTNEIEKIKPTEVGNWFFDNVTQRLQDYDTSSDPIKTNYLKIVEQAKKRQKQSAGSKIRKSTRNLHKSKCNKCKRIKNKSKKSKRV
jgi:hypothetical protein